MSCRKSVKTDQIRDGASNTILVAETLGSIGDGERTMAFGWAFGGLARGRGEADWGSATSSQNPDLFFFGDRQYSGLSGFGSAHATHVNVVKSDGSVASVPRTVSIQVWYGLCGARDGTTNREF
jgi:hypothetical protein